MEIEETELAVPENFLFPFEPYSIQNDFMKSLYRTLEGKKLGIFESPTGTGKSMSLICGSLKWLCDAQERLKRDVEANLRLLDEELNKSCLGKNWLEEHVSLAKTRQKKYSLQLYFNKIIDMEKRVEELKNKASAINEKYSLSSKCQSIKSRECHSKEKESNKCETDEIDDCDILLDDFSCDNSKNKYSFYSSDSEPEEDQNDRYSGIKVILCSRTHSQLSQLVREIQKSPYNEFNIRVVSLASRQNYCINDSVSNLKHLSLINEKCHELHKMKKEKSTKTSLKGEILKKQKVTTGCPFYNQRNVENLKLKSLTQILDIEQMVQKGEKLNGCPYYASRQAVCDAQVLIVPYNTILHKATRIACGINIKDSVIIIDEAHNLLDAIENIHSCIITGFDLITCHSQLLQYRDKFSERFSALNLLHLNQLIFIVNQFLKKLGGNNQSHMNSTVEKSTGTTLETLTDFILSAEIDTINFHKVLEFVSKSNLVNKLRGYTDKYKPSVIIHKKNDEKGVSAFLKKISIKVEEENAETAQQDKDVIKGNSLLSVISFIQSFTNNFLDGRIVSNIGKTIGSSSLKYLLLNAATQFSDLVKDARSIILAGGTMQPITEFTDQLFYLAGGTSDRISVFSCGHVIPKDNILPIVITSGPTGKTFDFSFQRRTDSQIVDELGRLLINVCNIVPAGVVCFFASYEYENFVFQHLEKTGIIVKLETKKHVIREPRKSNKVDEILKKYSVAVSKRGALLFSVVGGKLSEGLNFNDDLGRCIIIVGLPYPNLTSPELKEKMNYLNVSVSPTAGKVYYENLCMKAVNQSIGRSVRHKSDYASVLLIDQRFSKPKCCQALPNWIQKSLQKEEKFGAVIKLLARFFASKKKT